MLFYSKQKEILTPDEWLKLLCDRRYSRIRVTAVSPVLITTTWTGFDLYESGDIFETICRTQNDTTDIIRTDSLATALHWHDIIQREARYRQLKKGGRGDV